MKVKNTFILSGAYMHAYNDLRPHLSYDFGPSMLYECEGDKWFVTCQEINRPGLVEVTKEQADTFLNHK